jgi:hypothetical protein
MADLEIVGTGPVSKALYALRRIALTVDGINDPERVAIGYKSWGEDEEWEALVTKDNRETRGWLWLTLDRYSCGDMTTPPSFTLKGQLAVRVPQWESSWMSDAWDLANELLAEWSDGSNYLSGEPMLETGSFVFTGISEKGIAYFSFGPEGSLEFSGPC